MLISSLLGDIDIISTAGCETRIVVPKYKSVFDIGFADNLSLKYQNVFVSHTHADHVAGIWRHAAMQEFMHNRVGNYYAPKQNTGLIKAYLDAGRAMNHCDTTKAVVTDTEPTGNGVGGNVRIYSFVTDHRIPSCGYLGIHKKSKLKDEYVGLSAADIQKLVHNNITVNHFVENVEFAYTGDTRIDAVLNNKDVLCSDTLIIECTHVSKKSVEETRNNGHIHLDEIIANSHMFKNKEIILMHFSRMYCKEEIEKEIARIPEELRVRIKFAI